MIEHVWSVACVRCILDNRTNTVSIVDAIEQINVGNMPEAQQVLPVRFEVVTFWIRADPDVSSQGLERFSFWSPAGKKLLTSSTIPIDLSAWDRFRSIRTVEGIHLVGSGRYWIQVELQNEKETRWHKVARIPLQVVYAPTDTPQVVASSVEGRKAKPATTRKKAVAQK